MADQRDRDLSKVLSNVEKEMTQHPSLDVSAPASVSAFAPPQERARAGEVSRYPRNPNVGDSLEQIQQDFRKVVAELEQRFKVLTDELKRITG